MKVHTLDILPWHALQPGVQAQRRINIHRVSNRRTREVSILLQGDTGANVSATDQKNLLWYYRAFQSPLQVATYSTTMQEGRQTGTAKQATSNHEVGHCQAYGYGQIHVAGDDNSVMAWTALYTPGTNGTILSPDRYMWDHSQPHQFHHVGDKTGKGALWFTDEQGKECGRLTMIRREGLWYTTNHVLLPPQDPGGPSATTRAHVHRVHWADHTQGTRQTALAWQQELDNASPGYYCIPYNAGARPQDSPKVHSVQAPISTSHSTTTDKEEPEGDIQIQQATHSKTMEASHSKATEAEGPAGDRQTQQDQSDKGTEQQGSQVLPPDEALQRVELWHQRMGHPGPYALWQTQQHVSGIPTIPRPEKTLFQCPFCDKAKLHKSPRNRNHIRRSENPGTTFHMDLGFIRGLENVPDMIRGNSHQPGATVKESRSGHTCYLLIVDAATRYMWTFPLKTKKPPLKLLHLFLKKHGRDGGRIFTTKQGLLHQSQGFKELLKEHQYTLNEDDTRNPAEEDDMDQHLAVRTDNGGELGNSHEVAEVIASHGYILETTAPDTSSQNGLGERPHQTMKEKVRCLLYTAGLGTEFWADALTHATWLYNRTYHTALGKTPFEGYTGRRPLCDKIITFGAKIVAKRTGARRTALDPHTFDGIFLGYCSTQQNIKYWDIRTQCEKVTTHYKADEVQYSDAPLARGPAARHLMETLGGIQDHGEHDVTKIKEDHILVDPEPQFPHAAIAMAAMTRHKAIDQQWVEELRQFDITVDPYEPMVEETLPLTGQHPTLGLHIVPHEDYGATQLHSCAPGSVAARHIRRYKSRLRGAVIRQVNDIPITSATHLVDVIAMLRQRRDKTARISFAKPRWMATSGDGVPILQFDQLNVVAHHIHNIKHGESLLPTDPKQWPTIHLASLLVAMTKGLHIPRLTRRRLKQDDPENWPKFQQSEWKQLDKYDKQEMFGAPCPPPKQDTEAVILPWVWAYSWKTDPLTLEPVAKSRGTCNGGQRYGKVVTLAETFAACIEQPALRLFFAVTAALNYVILGSDVANAFAKAPPPDTPLYMQADTQFREWWTQHCKRPPIPKGWVIPIQHALQGHPEAPRLWNKHIDQIILKHLGFTPVTQARCLYYKRDPETNKLIILLRQVDDFMIAAHDQTTADAIRKQLQEHMTNELNDLGVVKHFTGLDVQQTKRFIKIHCGTYIDKILTHHGWNEEPAKPTAWPIPMRTDSVFQSQLALTDGPEDPKQAKELEDAMGFSYRQAIGELLFAMSTCRPDISTATVMLSQHAARPAKIHYQAVRAVFHYLRATKTDGIHYWRPSPSTEDLPDEPDPSPYSLDHQMQQYPEDWIDPTILRGGTDSTWASDRKHRRSVGGLYIMLAGGVIYYRTRIQPDTAQSSTEAELYSMTDAGKAALYLRSILQELDILQEAPTDIAADNKGAIQLSNAHQPTKHTRHVDMKHFVILEWTEEDKIRFSQTPTALNISDSLSKPTARIKHYEHFDILLGRRRPAYTVDNGHPSSINMFDASMFFRRLELCDVLDTSLGMQAWGGCQDRRLSVSTTSHSTSY